MFNCPKCGEQLRGDGYTKVIHCPNAPEESVEGVECDANPIFCREDIADDDLKDDLHAVDSFVVGVVRGLVASLRFHEASEEKIAQEVKSHPIIKALMKGRETMLAEQFPDSACAAIEFALNDSDGIPFLECWNSGDFDSIRREWPDAPAAVFIGADPLYIPTVPYEE